MAIQSGFIKRIRDIMRMDAGINGDAQRIEQMVWMLFLKVYDAKEDDWELWGDRIFEKCGIGRDEGGDGGKTLEIRGRRRLSARDGGANYQQS